MQAIYTVEFCLSIPYNKKTTLFEEERHERMNLLKIGRASCRERV